MEIMKSWNSLANMNTVVRSCVLCVNYRCKNNCVLKRTFPFRLKLRKYALDLFIYIHNK